MVRFLPLALPGDDILCDAYHAPDVEARALWWDREAGEVLCEWHRAQREGRRLVAVE